MKTNSKTVSNKTDLVKYTVSANKARIETYVAASPYYNLHDRRIGKSTTGLKTETMSQLYLTLFPFLILTRHL